MRRVRVTIDKVALNGVDPAHRQAVIEGLKAELARTLMAPASGLGHARSQSVAVLRAGRMALEPGFAGARKLGAAAARTIVKEASR